MQKKLTKSQTRRIEASLKPTPKKPLKFMGGVKTIRIPQLPPFNVDGRVTLDMVDIINRALKPFKPRKNVRIEAIYRFGTDGTSLEVVITKK